MSEDQDPKMPDRVSEYIVMTLNGMGPSTSYIDQFARQFIEYAAQQSAPVLELGTAYGFLTSAALKAGATIIANDLESAHLQILWNRTPEEYRSRLTLLAGRFPHAIDLPTASIAGCYVARMLGYLDPIDLQEGLKKLFHWLQTEAKLFIVSATPYSFRAIFKNIIPIYEKAVQTQKEWPGYISGLKKIVGGKYSNYLPDKHHFLDEVILSRELRRAGFMVEKTETYARKDLPDWALYDDRDAVAVIARKPQEWF
jgi:hypothetical protein